MGPVAGFVLGGGEREEEGGDETRIATEESQRQRRAGRLLCSRKAHKTGPAPQEHSTQLGTEIWDL